MNAQLHALPPREPSVLPEHLLPGRHADRTMLMLACAVAVIVHALFLVIELPDRTAIAQPPPRPEPPRITQFVLRPPDVPRPQERRSEPIRRVPYQQAEPVDLTPVQDPPTIVVSPSSPRVGEPPFELSTIAPPEPDGRARILVPGGDVRPPIPIEETKVKPDYPEVARMARYEGSVTLQAVIETDGRVGELIVLRVDPEGMGFEEAAAEAVSRWRYQPATLNGEPVAVYFTVQVDFGLN